MNSLLLLALSQSPLANPSTAAVEAWGNAPLRSDAVKWRRKLALVPSAGAADPTLSHSGACTSPLATSPNMWLRIATCMGNPDLCRRSVRTYSTSRTTGMKNER